MGAMTIVERWDASLRAGDWELARSLLTDDATYSTPEADPEYRVDCTSADEIVDLMRQWKGVNPDVEVADWAEHGDQVVAHLRQPAWGPDAEWYQVLTVRDGQVARLVDYGSEASALASLETSSS